MSITKSVGNAAKKAGKRSHKIQRLKVVIDTDDKSLALQLQDQFSQLCRGKIKTLLDKQLTQLSSDNEVLRIDKLEIDLGSFKRYMDEDKLLRDLPELLDKAVTQSRQNGTGRVYQLKTEAREDSLSRSEIIQRARESVEDEFEGFDEFEGYDEFYERDEFDSFFDQHSGENTEQKNEQSLQSNEFDQSHSDTQSFLFFLQTGHLPWWSDDFSANEIKRLFQLLTKDDGADLLRLMQDNPTVLARLSFQADAGEQTRLIELLAPLGYELSVLRFANACHLVLGSQKQPGETGAVILTSVSPFIQAAWQNFIELLKYAPASEVSFTALLERWEQLPEFAVWQRWCLTACEENKSLLNSAEFSSFIEQLRQVSLSAGNKHVLHSPQQQDNGGIVNDSAVMVEVAECPETRSDSLKIDNAGLFLLFEHLPKLFEQLGYIEKEQFKNQTVQQKAIHLLEYMVQGEGKDEGEVEGKDEGKDEVENRQPYGEAQLSLNKLLCGLQPSDPVWGDCYLTLHEKDSAEQLLEQVIKGFAKPGDTLDETHVESLADTDVNEFRLSYLQRRGLISVQDTAWLLRIEPEGRDILFSDHIQSYSSLCYPWMPVLLTIVWCEHDIQNYQV